MALRSGRISKICSKLEFFENVAINMWAGVLGQNFDIKELFKNYGTHFFLITPKYKVFDPFPC